ncbi:MAG: hypothetical protein OXC60_19680 [Litoreibacter sp.]|nr:hypothetical protein [Litoreibacter sp.]
MTQAAEFQERLNRINRGEQFVADNLVTKDLYQRRRRRRKQIQASALYSFVLLFMVGMISVMMIRYGRFQIFGIDRADITSLEGMILDGGGSLLMVAVIMVTTKLNSWIMAASQVAGAAASFLGMHWAVHRWPEFFAEMFSLQWLFMVMQSTDPEAILRITF